MNGLYNLVFGENSTADILLACLGLTQADVGRYRDAFIHKGEIVIHTRNGGGNRETYQSVIDELARHPNYLRDADDDFDCTYADIYFSFPEKHKDVLSQIAEAKHTPAEKWQILFEQLGKQ
jgi:hypothetical protein